MRMNLNSYLNTRLHMFHVRGNHSPSGEYVRKVSSICAHALVRHLFIVLGKVNSAANFQISVSLYHMIKGVF